MGTQQKNKFEFWVESWVWTQNSPKMSHLTQNSLKMSNSIQTQTNYLTFKQIKEVSSRPLVFYIINFILYY